MHHFQMIEQKFYLVPENMDQLSGLNIGSYLRCWIFKNLFLVAAIDFHYLEVIKSQLEHKVLYQLWRILVYY